MSHDAPDFSLQPSPRGRAAYAHPLRHYEAIFDTKVRQIKNWVRAGRLVEPTDLPPLDRPEEMANWWTRHMKQCVPARLLALKKSPPPSSAPDGATDPVGATPNNPPKEKGGAGSQSPRSAVNFETVEAMDLARAVESQRRVLAVLQRDYEQALSSPDTDESTITLRANRVDKCIERLRKIEGSLEEWRKSRGELVEIADVQTDWSNLLVALRNMRERMPADVAKDLINPGIPPEQFSVIQAAVMSAISAAHDREDALLRSARHWPASAQPPLAA